MKKLFYFGLMFQLLFSYSLVVNNKKDVEKLKTIGINCRYDKVNEFYRCVNSDDLTQLQRIKSYIKNSYNVTSYIVQSTGVKKNKKTVSQNKKSNTSKMTVSTVKSGYCLQIASSVSKNGIMKLFDKYKNLPLIRVEKIGRFYVLRAGEDRNYNNIRAIKSKINKGYIRKCDIVPERIVASSQNISQSDAVPQPATPTVIENKLLSSTKAENVTTMYDALNAGDLITAKKIANKLLHTKDYKDAYKVLGIVAMKMGQWGKACNYLIKSQNVKLRNTACYTYNLKTGYLLLKSNPKKSLIYFDRAKKYKNDKNLQIAYGYAYLNIKDYKKAKDIFENLYKKYPDNKDIIKGYIIALYNLKDYKKLEELKAYIPKKYLSQIETYNLYIQLDKAKKLMAQKQYKEAEILLLSLYKKHPSNINVLLDLGNLYLQTNQLDKAENFYQNVLLINPDNIYAIEGLRGVEIKRKNYKKALEYSAQLRKLGVVLNDRAIENLYYLQEAKAALKRKDCKNLGRYAMSARDLNQSNPQVYMILGDYYKYCENNKRLSFLNYQKGYQLGENNFDVKLKFLYALLNYDMFTQIKIVLSGIDPAKLTPDQRTKLKKFYANLYAKFASYKFNNKEYKTAIEACNQGLLYNSANPVFYEISGWSCFRLKNYKCAEDNFDKALALANNDKTKYALALTYIKENKNKEAEKLLDEIADTKNPDLRLKVANAYLILGKVSKAEKIFKSVKVQNSAPTQQKILQNTNKIINKEEPFENINKNPVNNKGFFPDVLNPQQSSLQNYKEQKLLSLNKIQPIYVEEKKNLLEEYKKVEKQILLKKNNYISYLELGVNVRSKTGTSGLDQLNNFVSYLKGDFFVSPKSSIYFKLGLVNLSSGHVANYNNLGSGGQVTNNDWIVSYTGIIPKIGFSYIGDKIFQVELGTTPMNNDPIVHIDSTITGKVTLGLNRDKRKLLLTFLREPVRDSILSYVGNNDPYNINNHWGRVINNELKVEYENIFDEHDSMLYVSMSASNLKGVNVNDNSKYEIDIFPLKYIGNSLQDADYAGVFAMMQSYERNENNFYYYSGGYFSPEYFLLIAPRYEGYSFYDDRKFGIRSYAMAGPLWFKDDKSHFTIGFETGVYGKYLLGSGLCLKGGADIRKSTDFTDFYFNLGIQYYFGHKVYISKSELNNNMKEMLRTW